MSNNESIQDTLEVIRRALEDEDDFSNKNENVLVLNKKINEDGTVNILDNSLDASNEVSKVIDKKLNDIFEKKMSSLLKNQLPEILDNYFKRKK